MSFKDELISAATRDKLRLHTPGHKGKLCSNDLTELVDDSFPNAALNAANARIARHYGARHAYMLCGGSSQGVKAAIYYTAANGITDINSHRSVHDGFKLAGKTEIAVGRRGDIQPIELKDIKSALTPDIGAVHVTSPTYYGYCADIDGISDFCKRHGLMFIVDGAHGAHFGASPYLPKGFADKCDICNLSAHKTLSALTQSAILLDNLNDSGAAALREAVDIMGTTSPSYLLYSSIDGAVSELACSAQKYAALYEPVTALKSELPFLKNDDFTRLVLDCAELGVDADELNLVLCNSGVYGEMTDGRRIVFILTAADEPATVEALRRALITALSEIKIK